jgi:hypothetical protein
MSTCEPATNPQLAGTLPILTWNFSRLRVHLRVAVSGIVLTQAEPASDPQATPVTVFSVYTVRAPAHTCVIAGLRVGVLPEASRRGIVGLDVVSHRNISPGPLISTGWYG